MAKMVMDGSSVAHVWAQQSQPFAHSHNRNVFFEGPTLYSYGRHFPLGRFVTGKGGRRAVLLNSNSYSVTTSKHKSYAWRAVHGLGIPVFDVPGCKLDHAENVKTLAEGAAASLNKAKRARVNKDWHLKNAAEGFDTAKRYAAFFGVKFKAANVEGVAAELERARLAELKRQREAAAEQRKRDADDFEAWKAGERDYCPRSYATNERGGAYIRIMGDELQTSLGARVPLDHAIRAFRFIKLVRARGEGWKANGHSIRVGHFTVSEITPAGDMVAGCHRFTWDEIEAAARVAHVSHLDPADTREASE